MFSFLQFDCTKGIIQQFGKNVSASNTGGYALEFANRCAF